MKYIYIYVYIYIYIYIYILPQRGRPRRSRSEGRDGWDVVYHVKTGRFRYFATPSFKPTAFKPIGANIILYKTYILYIIYYCVTPNTRLHRGMGISPWSRHYIHYITI